MDVLKSLLFVGIGVGLGFKLGVDYTCKYYEKESKEVYDDLGTKATEQKDKVVAKATEAKEQVVAKAEEIKEKHFNKEQQVIITDVPEQPAQEV